MLIETFRRNCLEKAYRRFHEEGRLLPPGVNYLDSWLTADGARCFQMMEAETREQLGEWMSRWDDLVEFEVCELGEKPSRDSVTGD